MKKTYTMEIAGLKRDLPLFPVNDSLQIAAFILFGDVEITCASAKALLEKSDLNISEVMEKVGFDDISYFSKQFRIFYAMSPREYRKY